jgi:hypothetical protein
MEAQRLEDIGFFVGVSAVCMARAASQQGPAGGARWLSTFLLRLNGLYSGASAAEVPA